MKIDKKRLDVDFIKKWMNEGLNPILLSVLYRRDIQEDEDLINTFSPLLENLPSPFLFSDITKAFQRIDQAISHNERIIVFGDSDVDGTTSTVMFIQFFKNCGALIDWEVPSGKDPYGLNKQKFSGWKEKNYSLCVTLDCGITNIDEINILKTLNIDTIIIDHHQPLADLPSAYATINPKCEPNFDFNNIAACSIVFIFILGYLFYKSSYYNKTITVFYRDEQLKADLYQNLILTDHKILDHRNKNEFNAYDDAYYYQIDPLNMNESELLPNLEQLTPLLNVADTIANPFLNSIKAMRIKARIALFNRILSSLSSIENIRQQFLPLVMLGTLADIMPLKNINRILAFLGLQYLKTQPSANLLKLCKRINIDPADITSKDIGWAICPLLNAPGRMGDANLTVHFLSNDQQEESCLLINKIIQVNEERKEEGNLAFNEFLNQIPDIKLHYQNHLAFFYSEKIHRGITGITAAKLSKHTNCPTLVAAKEGDCYTGSIRGETEFHFVKFLDKGADLLIQYGGHKNAAGFTFHERELENFKSFLQDNSSLLENGNETDAIQIDAEIPINFLNYDLYPILSILEPFGNENPNPVLYTPNLKVMSYNRMGKDKQHLKLLFETPGSPFVGVYWAMADWFEENYRSNQKYNVIYQLEVNKYNGQTILQMMVIDLEISLD